MRTDQLITLLATGAEPVRPRAAARRFSFALGLGVFGAAVLMGTLLGVRHDLAQAAVQPMFWMKIVFVAWLVAASVPLALRLSRPGARLAWAPGWIAAPVLAVWLMALVEMVTADPVKRVELFFGDTWASCPFLVALLSVPAFVAVIWAIKGLAPTRLRLAGAGAGLVSGATGALVYALHCPELSAPFLGFWYLLGMLIPTAVGTLLGPRLLRW